MALTFEVGNQWLGRAQFPAGIFTGTAGRLHEFLSFWGEGREPARVVLTSSIQNLHYYLGLPGLAFCPAHGSSSAAGGKPRDTFL